MGASQSGVEIGGSSLGYQVLRVYPNGPGSQAGLKAYFDFIVAIGTTRLSKEDGVLREILKASVDQKLKIYVYNTRSKQVRDVEIVPSLNWGGNGLLGISIKHTSFDRADERVWHVVEVEKNSPAEKAGLKQDDDYVIGADSILQESDDLYNLIEAHEGRALKLFVYNVKNDNCREVICHPNSKWGGKGYLGCEFGHGLLHRIPYSESDVKNPANNNSSNTGLQQGDTKSQPNAPEISKFSSLALMDPYPVPSQNTASISPAKVSLQQVPLQVQQHPRSQYSHPQPSLQNVTATQSSQPQYVQPPPQQPSPQQPPPLQAPPQQFPPQQAPPQQSPPQQGPQQVPPQQLLPQQAPPQQILPQQAPPPQLPPEQPSPQQNVSTPQQLHQYEAPQKALQPGQQPVAQHYGSSQQQYFPPQQMFAPPQHVSSSLLLKTQYDVPQNQYPPPPQHTSSLQSLPPPYEPPQQLFQPSPQPPGPPQQPSPQQSSPQQQNVADMKPLSHHYDSTQQQFPTQQQHQVPGPPPMHPLYEPPQQFPLPQQLPPQQPPPQQPTHQPLMSSFVYDQH